MLISYKTILDNAFKDGYAVGAFNCLSLENVIGVIKAAEKLNSPVILQLAEVQFPYSPMELMAPIFLEAAKRSKVPVAVHLDHGQSFETCARAISLGFNSVMFDGASLPYEDNIAITSQVVKMAKAADVDVEAELGKVGDTTEVLTNKPNEMNDDIFTNVEQSADFIEKTGIDALAIAIGNLHGNYIATPKLNIKRLAEIREKNNLPLVLHGGSGTSEEDFKSCVHNGIAKINVATAMQMAVAKKIKDYVNNNEKNNYIDMKWLMIEASEETAEYHIRLFESQGKA
ncbi:MAG: class II fructose-bisphosphate aldolase [Bacteroidales bacterium]|nr:class II fructose-bisphosphate aldolase [Bacteroidales bacterium]